MTVPALRTARLRLRPMQPEDADGLHAALGHRDVTRFLSDEVATPERTRAMVAYLCAGRFPTGMGHWTWVDATSGQIVGRGYLVPGPADAHGHAEMGWFLGRAHWGTGLASEACRSVLRYAFTALALPVVLARVHPENEASLHLAGSLGFTAGEPVGDEVAPRILMVARRDACGGRYRVGASRRPG